MVFHISNGFNPINTNNVGGVIFADIIENRKQVETALAVGTPSLIINNKVDDLDVSYIAVDNYAGGEKAAEYLLGLKHTKVAIITGNLNTQSGLSRFEGFKNFLAKENVDLPEAFVYEGDYSRRSARLATEQFLSQPEKPTAVFACSDDMALEAIAVIMEKGLKVPDDISVIGFDDNPACLYGPIALTTIKQPLFEMAEESVRLLGNIISEKSNSKAQRVLPPDLVIRDSCSAPFK